MPRAGFLYKMRCIINLTVNLTGEETPWAFLKYTFGCVCEAFPERTEGERPTLNVGGTHILVPCGSRVNTQANSAETEPLSIFDDGKWLILLLSITEGRGGEMAQ